MSMMQPLTNKLLRVALFVCALNLNQPALVMAQTGAPGTGKTLTAALLGQHTATQADAVPDELQAEEDQAEPEAAQIPGLHKATDVTLKRGQF